MFITADLTQAVIPEDKRKYISPVSRSSIFFASHAFPRVPSLASPFPYYRAFPRIPFSMFCTGRWASAQDDTSHLRATYARLTRDLRATYARAAAPTTAWPVPSQSHLGPTWEAPATYYTLKEKLTNARPASLLHRFPAVR